MKNKIKGILEDIKEIYYFKPLLDCIINLQEENNKLKNLKYKFLDCSGDEESFTLENYLEIGNKLYDLQEENERLNNIINRMEIDLKEMYMTFGEFNEEYTEKKIEK